MRQLFSNTARWSVTLQGIAVGVGLITLIVSAALTFGMDELFDNAVAEGRAFPFTGEADDLAFPTALMMIVACASTFFVAGTAFLSWRRARRGRMGWLSALSLVVLLVLFLVPLIFVVDWTGLPKFSLYSTWYRPLLVGAAAIYGSSLLGAAGLTLDSARRTRN